VVGLTLRLPDGSTLPIPPSIVTPVALPVFHEIVADCPRSIVEGETERFIVGEGGGGGGGASTVGVTAGGGATFFLHAVPVSAITTTSITMASVYRDFFIEISLLRNK
jgi:hypothetical protein